MSFTHFIRRAASRAIPSAIRSTTGQRCFHHHRSFVAAAAPPTRGGALSQILFRSSFSSAVQRSSTTSKSDDTLLKILDSEIQCAEESDDTLHQADDVPESFPFNIEDDPRQKTITLTRDFPSETITVVVHKPDIFEAEDDDDDDSETGNQTSIPMVVSVSKNIGPCLEFGITASPDEIEIETLTIKDPEVEEDEVAYEGPDFRELDENLQEAFHKFLDVRGINPSSTKFLHEYMINKDSKQYVGWLKKVKNFVRA